MIKTKEAYIVIVSIQKGTIVSAACIPLWNKTFVLLYGLRLIKVCQSSKVAHDQLRRVDWIWVCGHTFVSDCFIDMLICATTSNDESYTNYQLLACHRNAERIKTALACWFLIYICWRTNSLFLGVKQIREEGEINLLSLTFIKRSIDNIRGSGPRCDTAEEFFGYH